MNQPDQQHPSASSKLCNKFIPTYCTEFNPESIKFHRIRNRGDHSHVTRYCNTVRPIEKFRTEVQRSKQPTSLVDEAEVYGRAEEKKATIELLLKDDSECHDGGFSVIHIIGMGGLGNTTLALPVYNEKMVQSHFG